jgi:hypothetical protein
MAANKDQVTAMIKSIQQKEGKSADEIAKVRERENVSERERESPRETFSLHLAMLRLRAVCRLVAPLPLVLRCASHMRG